MRKEIIFELTNKYSIYSFGRFATWRNITADRLIHDIEIVGSLMQSNDKSFDYAHSLVRANRIIQEA